MEFNITCRGCGTVYQPSRDAIVAGLWQRACPFCFPLDDSLAFEETHTPEEIAELKEAGDAIIREMMSPKDISAPKRKQSA